MMHNNWLGRLGGDCLSLWDMVRHLVSVLVYPLLQLTIIVGSWAIFYGLVLLFIVLTK